MNSDVFRKGCHGIEHNYRVLLLIREICFIEKIADDQKEMLEFCAIFHDIGRVHDGNDDTHGFRSTKKLEENEYYGLRAFNHSLTRYIIENHCVHDSTAFHNIRKYKVRNREEAVFLIKAFKDSDNLDRVRQGDFDSSYLRLPVSHTLIPYANEIFHTHTDITSIENEVMSWIHSRAESVLSAE